MPVIATIEFEKLTRCHAVKLSPAGQCSVEEAAPSSPTTSPTDSLKSASQMNGAIVIFVDRMSKVSELVVIQNTFNNVSPLSNPATKVMISNLPSFIRNESLVKELSRYGHPVSRIRMISLGCRSPNLKHVVCRRRQVMIILKDKESHLNLSFSRNIEGYMVFVSLENIRGFGCEAKKHLVRSCLKKCGPQSAQQAKAVTASGPASVVDSGGFCHCCGAGGSRFDGGACRGGSPYYEVALGRGGPGCCGEQYCGRVS